MRDALPPELQDRQRQALRRFEQGAFFAAATMMMIVGTCIIGNPWLLLIALPGAIKTATALTRGFVEHKRIAREREARQLPQARVVSE